MASSIPVALHSQPLPAAVPLGERRNLVAVPHKESPQKPPVIKPLAPTPPNGMALQPQPLSTKTMTQANPLSFSDMSDEELFVKIREERSEAAFNALYKRYDKRLYAYCLRATGSHEAAKDAFQAVMSVVFEKRESFTGGNYAAWLFTIARHHVMKVSKRQQRDLIQNKPLDDDSDDMLPAESNASTEHHDFLLQQALDRAIALLPEDLREAFELKQYDGLQHEEIAQTLGITVSLAKVRVFRAKQALRQTLAPFIKELQ